LEEINDEFWDLIEDDNPDFQEFIQPNGRRKEKKEEVDIDKE